MSTDDWWDKGVERRALSLALPDATWPPEVGDRLHYNSGWHETSWTGEVRAVVDDRIAIVLANAPDGGARRGSQYQIVDRWWFEPDNGPLTKEPGHKGRTKLRKGPIPRAIRRAE